MLKIHEWTLADGALSTTSLVVEDGVLVLVESGQALPLPPGALEAVMKRYGAPLDENENVAVIDTLELDVGVLRHVRHLARWDVIARDWLVYDVPEREPVAAMATHVAAALGHLARAVSAC